MTMAQQKLEPREWDEFIDELAGLLVEDFMRRHAEQQVRELNHENDINNEPAN